MYDRNKGEIPPNITQDALVANVEISISGPRSFTAPTPTGILSLNDPLPTGTYQIAATKQGYTVIPLNYVLSSMCDYKDELGICHAFVAMYTNNTV